MTTQREKAELFLNLHKEGAGLLLPNAWDVASARLVEEAGFPVIATTSAGVAFALGYRDGQQISRDEMLEVVARIAKAVKVPVTADIEAGYGPVPEDVAQTIQAVIEAGAVGVNLEDNTGDAKNPLFPIEEQARRIAAARAEADKTGIPVVINARTDTYLFQVGEASGRFDETVNRAKAYLEAGASTIFVPGVVDPPTIQKLVKAIPAPLNIMVGTNAPSAPELFELGVRRVSLGAAVMLATMGFVADIARELKEKGTYEVLASHPYGFSDAWKLFS